MAIHNYVSLFGVVRTAPQIKTGMYGRTAMVAVTVVRGDRKEDTMLLRTSLKYSSPILFTQDEDLIDGISEWKENDVIYAKGFLATKEVEKKAICPHCGAVNLRREACQAESVRSGGNMIYFSPIFAEKVRSFEEQGEAHSCVLNRAEISNTVFLLGNLTCEPIQWYVEKKPYTRYQLAINRKYCPKGLQEVTERTDYPWVYSFGQQAVMIIRCCIQGLLCLWMEPYVHENIKKPISVRNAGKNLMFQAGPSMSCPMIRSICATVM